MQERVGLGQTGHGHVEDLAVDECALAHRPHIFSRALRSTEPVVIAGNAATAAVRAALPDLTAQPSTGAPR